MRTWTSEFENEGDVPTNDLRAFGLTFDGEVSYEETEETETSPEIARINTIEKNDASRPYTLVLIELQNGDEFSLNFPQNVSDQEIMRTWRNERRAWRLI
jgi:hypothetical protein